MNMEDMKDELERLVKIMSTLRGPEGCPWDKKQDYYSLQPYVIEEAYEVVEALQEKDLNLLKEELGDLLLQVVFQAQIGREKGEFNLVDVIRGISDKLIRRHPHVFKDRKLETAQEVSHVWAEIKKEEKALEGKGESTSILEGISRSQPALLQAYELQDKAAEVGFDWDDIVDVIKKVKEELSEVEEVITINDGAGMFEELGDLIFAVVNLARFKNVNPELALLKTNKKFQKRFSYIENEVARRGYDLEDLTLAELDRYWEESKKN